MATFTFNGSQSLSIPNFDPENDFVIVTDFDAADVQSFEQQGGSVRLTLLNGAVLTLEGATFADLSANPNSLSAAGSSSDIEFGIGTSGSDTTLDGNVVVGLAGNDTITVTVPAGSEGAVVFGNEGNDTINGGGLESLRIFGGQGNDSITGLGSGSVVYGGLNTTTGVDVITGGVVTTDEGITVFGGNGEADAEDGADSISGTAGDDSLYGNGGNDTLVGSGGVDFIHGGRGNDVITVNGAGAGTTAIGGLGNDTISAATMTLTSGETTGVTIYGGNTEADAADGADSITGSAGDDLLFGNGGNDTIVSGGGVDSIFGGQGADSISGNLGEGAQVYGGLDSDRIDVVVAAGAQGVDAGPTMIYGGNGQADAADGADFIDVRGSAADISVFGNGGNDVLLGGNGDDSLYGGQGNDTLFVVNTTVADNDFLIGGEGNDLFVFADGASDFRAAVPATTNPTAPAVPEFDSVDTIVGLNFDQDRLDVGVAVTQINSTTIADADDFSDIFAVTTGGATVANLITVSSGDLAGTYLAFGGTGNDTLINITGYTGTADAADFVTGTVIPA